MQGKIIGGRYHIISELGEGGFGQTYLAEDRDLPGNPPCVVKQFQPTATDPRTLQEARRLFDTETNILYKLGTHDLIPRLFAHFEEDGEFYLVEELIEGHDLNRELTPGKRLSENEVIAILQESLKVLEFVHQQQVIHRDIKPSNLMRRQQDGKIVLIGFGAVKQITTLVINARGKTSLTLQIGTYGYMPREQALGMPKFASDIYALGIVGIQAIAGIYPEQLTRDRDTGEVVWRYQVQINPRLADILDKMVRFDFRQRYSSATAVLEALARLATPPISIPPSNPEAWLNRGNTLCELKRYEEAISAYEEAILNKSDFYQAWDERGKALFELKRYEDAKVSYDKAISIKPDYPEAWRNKARVLFYLQRYNEAIAAFDKAIEFKPDDPDTWLSRGVGLAKLQRDSEALAAFDKALKFKPDDPDAWHNRGVALVNLKRYYEAIASFDKAIQLAPDDPDAWVLRGKALVNLELYSEALTAFDKAIQLKPDYQLAINNRKKVLWKLRQ